jgi:hypothetical protein
VPLVRNKIFNPSSLKFTPKSFYSSNGNPNSSKAVLLIDVNNSEITIECESLGKAIEFLKKKGLPASKSVFVKRLNTNQAYHGYYFKTL